MQPISLQETYKNKQILIIGSTGFIGKVLLGLLLFKFPDIEQIYLLVRSKPKQSASERVQEIIQNSPVFDPIRQQQGDAYQDWMNKKITALDGDLSLVHLGLTPTQVNELKPKLDLIINTAGMVSFLPDLAEALEINIQGTINVANFASSMEHAALLHVSTAFVAGGRQGEIKEEVQMYQSPNGKNFDVAQELIFINSTIKALHIEHQEEMTEALLTIKDTPIEKKRSPLKKALTEVGEKRAANLGWPNTYTYSKAVAEAWLGLHHPRLKLAIFRPSIVESAVAFPSPGWNEGFNTCAPLCYAAQNFFYFLLPVANNIALDIVPVDTVCNVMVKIGAALLLDTHAPVYHCTSSARNPVLVSSITDFTRNWYRFQAKNKPWYQKMGVSYDMPFIEPTNLLASPRLERFLDYFPKGLYELSTGLKNIKKQIHFLHILHRFYLPFIHDYHYKFLANEIDNIKVQETEFDFDIDKLNWENYWMNIEMPGLAKHCFPLFKQAKG